MLLLLLFIFFFVKQKTAYELRISDWSSDVCSSDLTGLSFDASTTLAKSKSICASALRVSIVKRTTSLPTSLTTSASVTKLPERFDIFTGSPFRSSRTICTSLTSKRVRPPRSEEHTSELQSLMRISYAVFCLKKKKHKRVPATPRNNTTQHNYT